MEAETAAAAVPGRHGKGMAKGKVFPHAVGELLNGSPAPLYGVKMVVAPDSEAA